MPRPKRETEREDPFRTVDFTESSFEERVVRKHEIEKSPETLQLIGDLNRSLPVFLGKYKLKKQEIAPERIHVLDPRSFKLPEVGRLREKNIAGMFSPRSGKILVLRDFKAGRVDFANVLVHEMIHANSFLSTQQPRDAGSADIMRMTETDNLRWKEEFADIRRLGFEIRLRGGGIALRGLNEAMTEELTKLFAGRFYGNFPVLDAELRERRKRFEARPIPENKEALFGTFVYEKERAQLNRTIDDLYERNPDRFTYREQVLTLFAKAAMEGRLLPVARLIEGTYGKGSFRLMPDVQVRQPSRKK